MDKKEIKTALRNIEGAITNVEKKNFKLFFFVADSKGVPVGSLAYTYDLAYTLKELGYNVQMLYADKEFKGVGSWLGEKYASLPHLDSQKDNIAVSPADFLFIPELSQNIMEKTRELPCKRISIIQNLSFLYELIPLGASLDSLGIRDCITTSKLMQERINELFHDVKTYVVRPSIDEMFTPSNSESIIVNIIAKNESEINNIIKPFKWRFPVYDFVTFRYIKGRSREEEAEFLKKGAITVWIDERTDFGFTALEAMASGNIIVGKIPENAPEWMVDENGELVDNGVWFYRLRDLPRILADVIQTVLYNKIPQYLYENMTETLSRYTKQAQTKELKNVLTEVLDTRRKELSLVVDALKNNLKDKEESK